MPVSGGSYTAHDEARTLLPATLPVAAELDQRPRYFLIFGVRGGERLRLSGLSSNAEVNARSSCQATLRAWGK